MRSWWWRTSSGTSSWDSRRSRRPRRAMDEVSGPIIAIALVLVRGVRADGVHQRPDRAVLPAVRADDRDLDVHLGVQLADAEPGARVAAAAAARRAARSACSGSSIGCSAGSSASSTASSRAVRRCMPAVSRVSCAWPRWRSSCMRGLIGADRRRLRARAAGVHPGAGQGLPRRIRAAARRRDARPHRDVSSGRCRRSRWRTRASRTRSRFPGSRSTASSTRRTPASRS